ncbi:hypothetical protein BpHYR1_044645 [Brachionus plicatilis]|uniref:Uncharacterized protein n=1 Tax=Brachionus plicatilis TaxID=10195 RepID=A0A3M7T6C3_BRAPC|nr:hypothetical protein BpHYR1_044645 [Brachionus plicatilis]
MRYSCTCFLQSSEISSLLIKKKRTNYQYSLLFKGNQIKIDFQYQIDLLNKKYLWSKLKHSFPLVMRLINEYQACFVSNFLEVRIHKRTIKFVILSKIELILFLIFSSPSHIELGFMQPFERVNRIKKILVYLFKKNMNKKKLETIL